MKPPPFEYSRPESLDEALQILYEVGDNGKVLAGGQSLIPLLAFRMARPAHLTDITRLEGLKRVTLEADGLLTIGALATHRMLETNSELATRCPAIGEAVRQIGHVAIRNRGTVGGSMVHADPAAEWPALSLLFDTRFHVRSQSGERWVTADEMFVSYMTTALAPDELLVEMQMQLPPAEAGTAFVEVTRRHGDFALAGAGSVVEIDDGVVSSARISVMSAGLTPIRAAEAEQQLVGAEPNGGLIAAAAKQVDSAIEPMEDVHGDADYKRQLAKVVVKRAIQAAVGRAGRGAT